MKDLFCDGFQDAVEGCLVRHRSIIDVLTKLSESSSRVNRAVAKAVTSCGCVSIEARKQVYPDDIALAEMAKHIPTHVCGVLCDQCRETLENELGRNLFYLAALCNLLDLNLYDALIKENERLHSLGVYSIT
ncbi:MAG: DUF1573 domain-containing protein [Bacillota bacterium]|nr:DUF1573 domain-containing protein [Bacillota bacterium]